MLLLGIDLGTSSVKVSVVEAATHRCLASAQYPDVEAEIMSPEPGWAEQNPEVWWENIQQGILRCHNTGKYNSRDIGAIGIAYQMHGLVIVDSDQQLLRNSIIWCDSRAVDVGNRAYDHIGHNKSLGRLLNSPGNFTASKLGWVKENEPHIFAEVDKAMLPGDYIAMKLTGESTSTISSLSEGILWDFEKNTISSDIIEHFGFDRDIFPSICPVFSIHGHLSKNVATHLAMKPGIPISYKAGDQLNNALSLNVLEPGEVAATAGTSGVIYGVSDTLSYDPQSRINSFAHVNYSAELRRIGVLLCINGVGIFNRWMKNMMNSSESYSSLNFAASKIPVGSDGLMTIPFGNGAERIFNNRIIGSHFHNLDFNIHGHAHLARAVQEGIAFSFRYGLDIMRENGVRPSVVRAGRSNLFLSDVFADAFASVNDVAIEFFEGDGSLGAAIGAGIGVGFYPDAQTALAGRKPHEILEAKPDNEYEELYLQWKDLLEQRLKEIEKQ